MVTWRCRPGVGAAELVGSTWLPGKQDVAKSYRVWLITCFQTRRSPSSTRPWCAWPRKLGHLIRLFSAGGLTVARNRNIEPRNNIGDRTLNSSLAPRSRRMQSPGALLPPPRRHLRLIASTSFGLSLARQDAAKVKPRPRPNHASLLSHWIPVMTETATQPHGTTPLPQVTSQYFVGQDAQLLYSFPHPAQFRAAAVRHD